MSPAADRGLRVLVAEDDPSVASLVREVLQMAGFRVTVVDDGDVALDAVRDSPPDAVVLDLMMPRVNGITVLERLRENPETEEIPVVVLTAKADAQTIWRGWESGCNEYITKPFRPDELLAALEGLLGRSRRRRTSA